MASIIDLRIVIGATCCLVIFLAAAYMIALLIMVSRLSKECEKHNMKMLNESDAFTDLCYAQEYGKSLSCVFLHELDADTDHGYSKLSKSNAANFVYSTPDVSGVLAFGESTSDHSECRSDEVSGLRKEYILGKKNAYTMDLAAAKERIATMHTICSSSTCFVVSDKYIKSDRTGLTEDFYKAIHRKMMGDVSDAECQKDFNECFAPLIHSHTLTSVGQCGGSAPSDVQSKVGSMLNESQFLNRNHMNKSGQVYKIQDIEHIADGIVMLRMDIFHDFKVADVARVQCEKLCVGVLNGVQAATPSSLQAAVVV